MAVLALDRLWVNLVSTGESVNAKHKVMPEEAWSNEGEVLKYANGRRRLITTPGEAGSFNFVLLGINETVVLVLRSWKTLPVQVRDPRGRKFLGSYLTVEKVRTYPLNVCSGEYVYDVGIALATLTMEET